MTIRLLGLLLVCSFVLGVLFTPLARWLARRSGLVDQPDGQRKMQTAGVPLGGGAAVLLAAAGALLVGSWLAAPIADIIGEQGTVLAALLGASGVICAVGAADDFHGLRGRHKLFGQLLAVSIVMGSGLIVNHIQLFGWQLDLGVLALPFTAFWLLGAINALNLIDGMDGLLSSLGAIMALALTAMALVAGQWAAAAVAACLAGALLAFLCFNFPPASIYLGDSGSMLVGLVVGVLAINSSLKAPATVALAAPAALLTIPIFDTVTAIVRRKLTGRSIYSTDRGHIHHCLLRSGLSTWRVLTLVALLCLLTVGGVLASLAAKSDILAVIAALVVVAILVISRLFGYAEFLLIKERLRGLWAAWRHGSTPQKTHAIEVRLQGSAEWKAIWDTLTVRAEQLNLTGLCLDVNIPALHEGYHARWDRLDSDPAIRPRWRADIPLVDGGHLVGRLEISGNRNQESMADKVAAMSAVAEDIEKAIGRLTGGAILLPGPPQPSPARGEGAVAGPPPQPSPAREEGADAGPSADSCLQCNGYYGQPATSSTPEPGTTAPAPADPPTGTDRSTKGASR